MTGPTTPSRRHGPPPPSGHRAPGAGLAGLAGLATCAVLALGPSRLAAQDLSFLDVPPRPRPARPAPSAAQRRGLGEIEGELTRFDERGQGYRQTVDALLARRGRQERRAVLQRYASALRDERRLAARARRRAIADLEAFVAQHPDEPRHAPGALLRLAELYVERALDAAPPGEAPDLEPAVRAARRVVVSFPGDPRRDRAAYLLGWALAETGRSDEAVEVWRAALCPGRFAYPAPPRDAASHPALAVGGRAPASLSRGPYAACVAPHPSPLAAEMWLRIGEHHFDAAELDAAISAYRRVVAEPDHRLFAFGLYKLAWSHYRAAHYPEAVERFSALVRYSDRVLRTTGEAGSELRDEAMQYLALTLAYDDWDEDGRPDHTAGGPHPLERLEDARLWPHDAPFAAEVYRRVGDVLFELGHPDEALVAWQMRLARFAGGCDDADVRLAIARAHRQLGDETAATRALEELARGATASREGRCADAAARTEALARRALVETARSHHRRGQALRQRALLEQDDDLLAQAREAYGAAIALYGRLLARAPSHPDSYQLAYDRADALFWSERYGEAARAYASVRDSPFDDRLFARAARRVVESLKRQPGAALTREEPSLRDGRPHPLAIPESLQPAARAREIYVRWVRPEEDDEGVRDAYAFNNAILLYVYGHWTPARARLRGLFEARCRGPEASEVGLEAWRALRAMAAETRDVAALEALTRDLRARQCTFQPDGPPVLSTECDAPGSLACEVPALEAQLVFARLSEEAAALDATPDRGARGSAAESIAARLIATVDRAPTHPQAPAALLLAARLLDQQARRPQAAAAIYQRIVDHVAPDRPELEEVVAEAHFQLARAAQRAFDYERALSGYRTIAGSSRFARSSAPTMLQRRRDAEVNAALLTARLGRHLESAAAWTRAAALLPPSEAREAQLRAAAETLRGGRAEEAAAALERWTRAGGTTEAFALLAEARAALGQEAGRERALAQALEAHRAGRGPDRRRAAEAALALARARDQDAPARPLAPGVRPTTAALVETLRAEVDRELARARPVLEAYEDAIGVGDPEARVTALERQGAVYEALVRGVLGARIELPRDLGRRLRRASSDVRDEARAQLEDATRAALEARVRPLECLAVQRYVLSARLATRASLPTLAAHRATERLAAYGEERVRECVAEAAARDPGFDPYRRGELDRARAGVHPDPSAVRSPTLAR